MVWAALKTPSVAALTVAVAFVLGLGAAPASAAKPSGEGSNKEEHAASSDKDDKDEKRQKAKKKHAKSGDKGGKRKKAEKKHAKSKQSKHGQYFRDKDERAVRDYYTRESRNGKGCPPGLAKKDNGCMPPGLAKKRWARGEPLPRDLEHHDLPRELLDGLPLPPDRQRYVRVASDILLVGTDTNVVIDAIVDAVIP